MPYTTEEFRVWEAKQSEKALDAFDRLEHLLMQDEDLLRNLYNDDLDIYQELRYLADTEPEDYFDDLTDDNINWIYNCMLVNLQERYNELTEDESEDDR
jgi:hypothetical protein